MSLKSPRLLIIQVMEGINYVLERDAFDFENVGNSKLKKGFHLEQGEITSLQVNQATNAIEQHQVLRFWEKDSKNTHDGMLQHLDDLETILDNILEINNRTNGVINIIFNTFNAVPLSNDNDKIIRGELSLTVTQELCFTTT